MLKLFGTIMCIMMNSAYPCGHCYECLSRLRSDWSLRLQEEWINCGKNAFHAILTYDNEHLPKSPNGLPSNSKDDCVKFIKRLRHAFEQKIKYFLVSEYGSITQRPHYHIILFNINPNSCSSAYPQMMKILQDAWQKGEVRKRSSYIVSEAQLHYVLKDIYNWTDPLKLWDCYQYLDSRKNFKKYEKLYQNFCTSYSSFLDSHLEDDRPNNFRLMSKKLGFSYIEKARKDFPSLEQSYKYIAALPYSDNYFDEIRAAFSNKDDVRNFLYDRYQDNIKFFRDVMPMDFYNGRYIVPDELRSIRNFVEKEEKRVKITSNGPNTTYNISRYALPRYWRDKLIPKPIRYVLNLVSEQDKRDRINDYYKKFGQYDLTHDVPMYIEQNRLIWKRAYKSHKDKYLQNLQEDKYFD